MEHILYLFLRIAVLSFVRKLPRGAWIFYMPGKFRINVHFETWYMAFDSFDSKILCLVLKSLDGHETGRQATDLDENFGTPYSFWRRLLKSQSRGRFRPSQNRKFNFSFFTKIFAQTVFPSGSVCENCPGDFCARIAQGGVLNFSSPDNSLKKIQ